MDAFGIVSPLTSGLLPGKFVAQDLEAQRELLRLGNIQPQ